METEKQTEKLRAWPAVVVDIYVDWGAYKGLDLDQWTLPATLLAGWLGISWEEVMRLFHKAGVQRDVVGLSTVLGESLTITLGQAVRHLAEEVDRGRA